MNFYNRAATLINNEITAEMKKRKLSWKDCPVSSDLLADWSKMEPHLAKLSIKEFFDGLK